MRTGALTLGRATAKATMLLLLYQPTRGKMKKDDPYGQLGQQWGDATPTKDIKDAFAKVVLRHRGPIGICVLRYYKVCTAYILRYNP